LIDELGMKFGDFHGFSQQSNFHLRQAQGRTNALVHIHHDLVEWDLSQVHSDPPSGYDIQQFAVVKPWPIVKSMVYHGLPMNS